MQTEEKITTLDGLIEAVEKYGMLMFWDEERLSAWTLSGINFNAMWSLREQAVNSKRVIYGKYALKKATFVSKSAFPYLAALRRDGYDFDSLSDEGRVPNREALVMNAVGNTRAPSYKLGQSLGIKGFDAAVTSLQYKTYLCLQFKKSYMGTALLCRPEDEFGYDYVRSAYSLTQEQCVQKIKELCPGLSAFNEAELKKLLAPAV